MTDGDSLFMKILKEIRRILPFSTAWSTPDIDSVTALRTFLDTRAAFVGQTVLYGYLKTRSGVKHQEIFQDDVFVVSINYAKWRVYLACLSDLAVYAGARIAQDQRLDPDEITSMMTIIIEEILSAYNVPPDADPEFASASAEIVPRLRQVNWMAIDDWEDAFSLSPETLYEWAPIAPGLKEHDRTIVINSIRFKWRDIRERFRKAVRPEAVVADWRARRTVS